MGDHENTTPKISMIGISDEGAEGTGHRGLIYSFEGGGSGRHSIGENIGYKKMSEESTGT